MISFGVVNTIVSPLVGFMVKYVGRPLLFVAAMVVDAGLLVLLRLWVPNENQMALFFVIPGAWAFADAIWQTQNSCKCTEINILSVSALYEGCNVATLQ